MILETVGRFLLVFGAVVVVIGIILTFSRHIPFLGRLPGDLFFQKGSLRIYLPIMTCLILSLIITLGVNIFMRR